MQKKSLNQWIEQGKKSHLKYIFYQTNVFLMNIFLSQHPGGAQAINKYIYKDVTEILFSVYPHNKHYTLRKLQKYHVGQILQKKEEKYQKENVKEKEKITKKQNKKEQIQNISHHKKQIIDFSSKQHANKSNILAISNNQETKKLIKKQTNIEISKTEKQNKMQGVPSKTIIKWPQKFNQQNMSQLQKSQIKQDNSIKLSQKTQTSYSNQIDEQKPLIRIPFLIINRKTMTSLL